MTCAYAGMSKVTVTSAPVVAAPVDSGTSSGSGSSGVACVAYDCCDSSGVMACPSASASGCYDSTGMACYRAGMVSGSSSGSGSASSTVTCTLYDCCDSTGMMACGYGTGCIDTMGMACNSIGTSLTATPRRRRQPATTAGCTTCTYTCCKSDCMECTTTDTGCTDMMGMSCVGTAMTMGSGTGSASGTTVRCPNCMSCCNMYCSDCMAGDDTGADGCQDMTGMACYADSGSGSGSMWR